MQLSINQVDVAAAIWRPMSETYGVPEEKESCPSVRSSVLVEFRSSQVEKSTSCSIKKQGLSSKKMKIYHWKRTTTRVIFVSLLTFGITLRWIAVRDSEIEGNASVDTLESEMASITFEN